MKKCARLNGYIIGLALVLLALAIWAACRKAPSGRESTLTLVYTSEVGGALDPCG